MHTHIEFLFNYENAVTVWGEPVTTACILFMSMWINTTCDITYNTSIHAYRAMHQLPSVGLTQAHHNYIHSLFHSPILCYYSSICVSLNTPTYQIPILSNLKRKWDCKHDMI